MARKGNGPQGPKSIHEYPAEVREAILAERQGYRDGLLIELAERLESYRAELERADPAHMARLGSRKKEVWSLIHEAERAWVERVAPPDEFEILLMADTKNRRQEETDTSKPALQDMTNVHILRWRRRPEDK